MAIWTPGRSSSASSSEVAAKACKYPAGSAKKSKVGGTLRCAHRKSSGINSSLTRNQAGGLGGSTFGPVLLGSGSEARKRCGNMLVASSCTHTEGYRRKLAAAPCSKACSSGRRSTDGLLYSRKSRTNTDMPRCTSYSSAVSEGPPWQCTVSAQMPASSCIMRSGASLKSLAASLASSSVKASSTAPRTAASPSNFARSQLSTSAAKKARRGRTEANSVTSKTAERSSSGAPGNNDTTAMARNWKSSWLVSRKCACSAFLRGVPSLEISSLWMASLMFRKKFKAKVACTRDPRPASSSCCCSCGQPAGQSEL
mmetsp:Transcript_86688/g.248724  ORF Transcript_86688/g.248724 Transcript_86688/m.248724 type:complete len:312 (-) Transcript_86688:216-1151(-)